MGYPLSDIAAREIVTSESANINSLMYAIYGSRTDVTSVGSAMKRTKGIEILSQPETMKQNSKFRAKVLRREVSSGWSGQTRVFLYELIKKSFQRNLQGV